MAFIVFLVSFIILIVVGHKAAFRAHPAGLFAQWFEPRKILTARLDESEKYWVTCAFAAISSAFVGLVLSAIL